MKNLHNCQIPKVKKLQLNRKDVGEKLKNKIVNCLNHVASADKKHQQSNLTVAISIIVNVLLNVSKTQINVMIVKKQYLKIQEYSAVNA